MYLQEKNINKVLQIGRKTHIYNVYYFLREGR